MISDEVAQELKCSMHRHLDELKQSMLNISEQFFKAAIKAREERERNKAIGELLNVITESCDESNCDNESTIDDDGYQWRLTKHDYEQDDITQPSSINVQESALDLVIPDLVHGADFIDVSNPHGDVIIDDDNSSIEGLIDATNLPIVDMVIPHEEAMVVDSILPIEDAYIQETCDSVQVELVSTIQQSEVDIQPKEDSVSDVEILERVEDKQVEKVMHVDHVEFVIPHKFQYDLLVSNCFFVLKFIQVDESKFGFVYVIFLLLKFYKVRGRVIMNKGFVMFSCGHGFSPTNLHAMVRGRIIFQEGGNDMIRASKEWTNDYGACLSGDDNDLKTKTSLILQSQESQQVKVKVNIIIKAQRSRKVNPRPSQWSRVELNLILRVGLLIHNSKSNWKVKIGFTEYIRFFGP